MWRYREMIKGRFGRIVKVKFGNPDSFKHLKWDYLETPERKEDWLQSTLERIGQDV